MKNSLYFKLKWYFTDLYYLIKDMNDIGAENQNCENDVSHGAIRISWFVL